MMKLPTSSLSGLLLLLVACAKKPAVAPDRVSTTGPTVRLDGVVVEAWWDDGDTFSIPNPEGGKRIRARLDGFNTLESYGPVHRWGTWTSGELYAIAKQAGERARSETWSCTVGEGSGGYGRIRVDCPDLRWALVSEGLAHVFGIEQAGPEALLVAQQEAIDAGRGMWAKGAPEGLITSLHSVDERDGDTTYNRIADLSTGIAAKHEHSETYATCQEVCQMGSCMVYVPFAQRYDEAKKADCLRESP